MNRIALEHLLRAAAAANEREFVVIGSQAILGQFPHAPDGLLVSIEADMPCAGSSVRRAVTDARQSGHGVQVELGANRFETPPATWYSVMDCAWAMPGIASTTARLLHGPRRSAGQSSDEASFTPRTVSPRESAAVA